MNPRLTPAAAQVCGERRRGGWSFRGSRCQRAGDPCQRKPSWWRISRM